MVLHTYVLRVQYSCGVVLVFWFWREIVLGVTYVLSVQYSCAVVSVFWLRREIYLKMRTRFYKIILLGCFFLLLHISFLYYQSCQKYEHRQSHFDFLNNACWVSFFKKNNSLAKICFLQDLNFLLLRISFLYCIDLHPYNHHRFSKILRPFCASRNW